MNIGAILSELAKIEKRIFAAAESAIVFVRHAYGDRPGDAQHSLATELLRTAFPRLTKWAAHALIGLVFGWIERTSAEKLKQHSNFTLDTEAPDTPADIFKESPFTAAAEPLNIAPVGEFSPPQGAAPLQPSAPTG